jgi:dTMP kinase
MSSVLWAEKSGYQGVLIVFDGGDGCGKTTQIERLRSRLAQCGVGDVLVTKQPTDWYRSDPYVRSYLEEGGDSGKARSLALFAAADRVRHCREVIEPALRRGAIVLCDRYIFSSLVYFDLRGVSQDFVAAINAGIPEPDLAIFLQVPAGELFKRLIARDGLRRKHEEQSTFVINKVQQGFERLSNQLLSVDGDRSVEAVEVDIWSVARHLPRSR